MAQIPESALCRKLRGPMADWGMAEMLLRQIDLRLAGANWQRGGGKGTRPKPIPLPSEQPKQAAKTAMPGLVQRMKNLGQIPADS